MSFRDRPFVQSSGTVKGHIPQEIIDETKVRTNIVDLVSEYVALKKAGRNYIGLCPFHKEKTPSFTVNPDKQIFYCFGCGEGGNAISFVMKINNMAFPEAVRMLARKAGVTIPERKMSAGERTRYSEREQLVHTNTVARDFFVSQLTHPQGNACRDYLDGRSITEEVRRCFHLGYAPGGWRTLTSHLEKQNIPLSVATQAGVIIAGDKGNHYDRFRDRLIFPIERLDGIVVAFGGRVLGTGEPKYLNSPETPVYVKGEHLYGLSRTKQDIRQQDFVIIVEGYFDVLTLWSGGIRNVIGTLGTALTRQHVTLIRRFTHNIVLLFDADQGGRGAVERSLPLFLSENMTVRVAVLPGGYDPADYVENHGAHALNAVIDTAYSAVDYYIDTVLGAPDSVEARSEAIRSAVPVITAIADPLNRNLFVKRVAERCSVDERLIRNEMTRRQQTQKAADTGGSPQTTAPMPAVDRMEMNFIHILGEYTDIISIPDAEKALQYLADDDVKRLGRDIISRFRNGLPVEFATLIDEMPEGPAKAAVLRSLVDESPFTRDQVTRVFSDTLDALRIKWFRNRRHVIQKALVRAQGRKDRALCEKLLREKDEILRAERGRV